MWGSISPDNNRQEGQYAMRRGKEPHGAPGNQTNMSDLEAKFLGRVYDRFVRDQDDQGIVESCWLN